MMGNTHGQGKGSSTDLSTALKGYPMLFHTTHSTNIQVLGDRRSARRIESFCKGICFGSRPVAINERVYLKFLEISTSWSGVLRFGYTSNDPTYIDAGNLPRYACPDLTNREGFWAKALPERMAEQGNVLYFQVTRTGEVTYGLNDIEKGVFLTDVPASKPLWPVVDIYGNTAAMEFTDGHQLQNISSPLDNTLMQQLSGTSLGPSSPNLNTNIPPPASSSPSYSGTTQPLPYPLLPAHAAPVAATGGPGGAGTGLSRAHTVHQSPSSYSSIAVNHYSTWRFTPLPFHSSIHGRNVNLSHDKIVAVRTPDEYCNGYVFTPRPFICGERIVIQILSVDLTFGGGLAFGMTACDPKSLTPDDLPDDSDLLLDRLEYWVVNKDVCTNPEVRDEICFHLTEEGEVRYGRNGHHITTLMHVDKTLPMWAFFDVYGSTQKIKCFGCVGPDQLSAPGLTPPRRIAASAKNRSTPDLHARAGLSDSDLLNVRPPPPRPAPPPRPSGSPVAFAASVSEQGDGERGLRRQMSTPACTPPQLPPKQRTQSPSPALMSATPSLPPTTSARANLSIPTPPPAVSSTSSPSLLDTPPNLPPPLIPIPAEQAPTPPKQPQSFAVSSPSIKVSPPGPKPAIPPRLIDRKKQESKSGSSGNIVLQETGKPGPYSVQDGGDGEGEEGNSECCVCFEKPPNCVVYTCGHMCMCYACALDIKDNQDGLCPMCRQEIKDIIKIFRS